MKMLCITLKQIKKGKGERDETAILKMIRRWVIWVMGGGRSSGEWGTLTLEIIDIQFITFKDVALHYLSASCPLDFSADCNCISNCGLFRFLKKEEQMPS